MIPAVGSSKRQQNLDDIFCVACHDYGDLPHLYRTASLVADVISRSSR